MEYILVSVPHKCTPIVVMATIEVSKFLFLNVLFKDINVKEQYELFKYVFLSPTLTIN